jgi:(p)ppGpp synthase/HD superfamily hydrolase
MEFLSARVEKALRWAALCHDGQKRKASSVPYFEHVAAVALILERAGFDEDVVVAGLLHDLVEDTDVTVAEVADRFGTVVADIVMHCSEVKNDAAGEKRPWIDRKRDHVSMMATAPEAARAVMLADKLHNIVSTMVDLGAGVQAWSKFNADRDQILWYYRAAIEACAQTDSSLEPLAAACRDVVDRLSQLP